MIKVPSQYVTAVEIALGGAVQSIITNNENDAKLLIEYLKNNKTWQGDLSPYQFGKAEIFQ